MSSSVLGGKKEKLITQVVWGSKSRAERERKGGGDRLSEGGVHSPVEFDNFECFVPLQFGAGQVLLELPQH